MTTPGTQPSSQPGTQTIIEVLDRDLAGIGELAGKLASTTDVFDEGVETAQLVREIVQHHVAAEQFLHPLIARQLPDGERISRSQFAEHRKLEDLLRRLEDLDPATAGFATALGQVRDQWQVNAGYLKTEVFPALQASVDSAELRRLGESALGAEQAGPTRPRTLAVQQPVANVVLSLAQGFVDRTIDAFGHRGHEGSAEIDDRLKDGRYDHLED